MLKLATRDPAIHCGRSKTDASLALWRESSLACDRDSGPRGDACDHASRVLTHGWHDHYSFPPLSMPIQHLVPLDWVRPLPAGLDVYQVARRSLDRKHRSGCLRSSHLEDRVPEP